MSPIKTTTCLYTHFLVTTLLFSPQENIIYHQHDLEYKATGGVPWISINSFLMCPDTHLSEGALMALPRPQLCPDAQPDSFSVGHLLHFLYLQQGEFMSVYSVLLKLLLLALAQNLLIRCNKSPNLPLLVIFLPSLWATLPLGLPVSSKTSVPGLKEGQGAWEQGNHNNTSLYDWK